MSGRLADLYRTAFVTGASGGLGQAFVEMLLAEGVRVWGTARDVGRLSSFQSQSQFVPVALDLADPAAAEAVLLQAASDAGGAFDVVVANAGYGAFGDFAATDFGVWQKQLDSMLVTTVRLSHAALRQMRSRNRGCLVHISSLAVEFPLPFMSGYNIAKAGLSALSESLFVETRGTGVTVVDFRPGDYRTAFNQAMQSVSPAAPSASPLTARAWQTLEANLRAAPLPAGAAADLRRVLLRRKSGVVRSGSFFQASLAPLLARLVPAPLRRAIEARYFGLT